MKAENSTMKNAMTNNSDFRQWFVSLKARIRQSQIKAAVRVNEELLRLYWDLGRDIVVRQMDAEWGSAFFEQLSRELRAEFPEMSGFSSTNLKYCKRFFQFYTQESAIRQQGADEILNEAVENSQLVENDKNVIRQQLVDEFATPLIFQIPWGQHIDIFTKCKSVKEALFYIRKTVENGWSRAVLMNFLETDLYQRQDKTLNNFERLLHEAQSDLAKEIVKDPYNFDFLTLTESYRERELEAALSENITRMLLELGKGFAFVGRQVPIAAGNKELFMDMLFYHLKLRCYVVEIGRAHV